MGTERLWQRCTLSERSHPQHHMVGQPSYVWCNGGAPDCTCGAAAYGCPLHPMDSELRAMGEDLDEHWARGEKAPSETVLDEAKRIIHGARREAYGGPLESFTDIGRLWSVVLQQDVSPEQVALCLVLLKVHRAANGERGDGVQRDSVVDIAGYAGCLDLIAQERGGWSA